MKKGKKLNNLGFSLIELIVVILIIAIIGGVAVIAFSSVFNTKTNAAAKNIQDALKQTRIDALGLENSEVAESGVGPAAGVRTNVYAKFYIKDGKIVVDVCSDKSGTESVLDTNIIGTDSFKLDFCNASGSNIASISSASSSTRVYLYFKKSTGGISRLYYTQTGSSGKTTGCEMIKVTGPSGETFNIILVALTGRCYIDY